MCEVFVYVSGDVQGDERTGPTKKTTPDVPEDSASDEKGISTGSHNDIDVSHIDGS